MNFTHILGWLPAFALTVAGVLIALFLGLVGVFLPWWFVLAVLMLPIVLVLAWLFPLWGVFAALLFSFGIIPSFLGPRLVLSNGSVQPQDFLLVAVCAVAIAKALVTNTRWLSLVKPYVIPFVLLTIGFAVAFVHGKLIKHHALAISDARHFVGWLIVPMLFAATTTVAPPQRKTLLTVLLLAAMVAAVGVIYQSLTGTRIMELGRVEALDATRPDVTRITAGGSTYLMIFALFWTLARYVLVRDRVVLTTIASGVLCLALMLTFGRGVWAATAIGAVILLWYLGGFRLLLLGIVTISVPVVITLAGLNAAKPKVYEAVVDRAFSTGREIESGGSFGWRRKENAIAMTRIVESPIWGIGFGGQYKRVRSFETTFDLELTYIHNSYLYFPLKMGLIGVLVPIAFVLAVTLRARQPLRRERRPYSRATLVAAFSAFISFVIVSYTQPEWTKLSSIVALCIFLCLVELVRANVLEPLPDDVADPRSTAR